jgi:hypothetical protein
LPAIGLSICLAILLLWKADAVNAQGKSKGKPAAGGAAAMPSAPPASGMGAAGAGLGSAKKGIKKPGQKTREKGGTDEVDVESLPEGYEVPPEPPEPLTTSEGWDFDPADGDDKKRRPMLAKYKSIFQAGMFSGDADKKLVVDIIRYKLAQMTLSKNRDKIHTLRTELLNDIKYSPTNKNGSRDVRKFMLKTIVDEAPQLFKYNAIARINAAILLAELSEPPYNEADADGPRKPAEPCVRAFAPLMELVKDKQQLTAVRIWGVNGLVRIAMVTDKAQQRFDIVETLVKLLEESASEHEWYQWRLVEGLGRLGLIQNQAKSPVVPVELARVLADEKRPWLVRAEAAQSLGRLPYSSADNIDLGMIAHLTAELTRQMTDAYNKEKPKRALWKLCFIKVYGAFKPVDDDQKRGLMTQVEKGGLQTHKGAVQEAFKWVLPIVRAVVTGSEGIETSLADLKKWLEANPFKSFRLHPDMPPIARRQENAGDQRPADVPPAADGNGR